MQSSGSKTQVSIGRKMKQLSTLSHDSPFYPIRNYRPTPPMQFTSMSPAMRRPIVRRSGASIVPASTAKLRAGGRDNTRPKSLRDHRSLRYFYNGDRL